MKKVVVKKDFPYKSNDFKKGQTIKLSDSLYKKFEKDGLVELAKSTPLIDKKEK